MNKINWANLNANRAALEAERWEGTWVRIVVTWLSHDIRFHVHEGVAPIKKQFYFEDPSIAAMTEDQAQDFR